MHASSYDSGLSHAGAAVPHHRVPEDAPCAEVPLVPAASATTASGALLDSTSSTSGVLSMTPCDFQGVMSGECGAETPTQARASRTGISDLFEEDDVAVYGPCDRSHPSPLRTSFQEDSSGSFFSLDMMNNISSSSQGKASTEILPAWSLGSDKHATGDCTPCLFWFRGTCRRERDCLYCHFVHPGGRVKRVRPTKRHRSNAAQGRASPSGASGHVASAASTPTGAAAAAASASLSPVRAVGPSFSNSVNVHNQAPAVSSGTPALGMPAYFEPLPPQAPWMSAELDIQHLSF